MFTVNELRRAYERAVKEGLDTFQYQGQWYHVMYVKYLLEYLEGPARA